MSKYLTKTNIIIGLIALVLGWLLASAVLANDGYGLVSEKEAQPNRVVPQCMTTEAMLDMLENDYGEVLQIRAGAMPPGSSEVTAILHIVANSESGSWTAFFAGTDGAACIASSGGHFELLQSPSKASGIPL